MPHKHEDSFSDGIIKALRLVFGDIVTSYSGWRCRTGRRCFSAPSACPAGRINSWV